MKRFVVFLTLLVLPVGIAAGEQSLVNAKAPEFILSDQYDRQYSLESFAGMPLVLLASDKKGEEQNRQWGALIQKKYGKEVRVLGVADVRTVPFFLKGKIKKDFRKDPNSILLDWDGNIFTAYRLSKGVSNVVLIDSTGSVRYLHAGGPTDESGDLLFREIDGMRDRNKGGVLR